MSPKNESTQEPIHTLNRTEFNPVRGYFYTFFAPTCKHPCDPKPMQMITGSRFYGNCSTCIKDPTKEQVYAALFNSQCSIPGYRTLEVYLNNRSEFD
jgi:hypothetical protein